MYRFLLRPRWIAFHLAVALAIFFMLWAATWQWSKHIARDNIGAEIKDRQSEEPVELSGALATSTPSDLQYTRVTATGHFLPDDEFVEINQALDGTNGVNAVTLFQVDDGPIVVVNRGFVEDGTAVPAPQAGSLRIGGTARLSEPHRTGELTDNNDGATNEIRRVDLSTIGKKSGVDLAPVYIDFIASEPATPAPPIPLPAPTLGDGPPHVSYTVQWCIFSTCALVGWVFAIRRSVRTRQRALAAGAPPPIEVSEDRPEGPSA